MSRELFVDLPEGEVVAKCLAQKVSISNIERLPAGGVRLVCSSSDGAGQMLRKLKRHLIDGHVVRQGHRPRHSTW